MFGLVALTALALDKRKREREKEREGGREGVSVHADILPAGLVIDEPQSVWEPEMARLMNEAFLLPPKPAPTFQPLHQPPLPAHPTPLHLTLPYHPPPSSQPVRQQAQPPTPQTPQTRAPRPALAPPSHLACPPSAPLNRACAQLACQATHTHRHTCRHTRTDTHTADITGCVHVRMYPSG